LLILDKNNELRLVAEILYIICSLKKKDEKYLEDLQEILDLKIKENLK